MSSFLLSFKLSVRIFDVFGEALDNGVVHDFFTASEGDLDRQLRAADAKLGNYGFQNVYGRKYFDPDDPNSFKIDCILFAADDDCIGKLNQYAERKFHELNDKYRKYIVNKSEKIKNAIKAYKDEQLRLAKQVAKSSRLLQFEAYKKKFDSDVIGNNSR